MLMFCFVRIKNCIKIHFDSKQIELNPHKQIDPRLHWIQHVMLRASFVFFISFYLISFPLKRWPLIKLYLRGYANEIRFWIENSCVWNHQLCFVLSALIKRETFPLNIFFIFYFFLFKISSFNRNDFINIPLCDSEIDHKVCLLCGWIIEWIEKKTRIPLKLYHFRVHWILNLCPFVLGINMDIDVGSILFGNTNDYLIMINM